MKCLPATAAPVWLRALPEAGASIRQTGMLTGISFGIVRKYAKLQNTGDGSLCQLFLEELEHAEPSPVFKWQMSQIQ